jgi:radical SAM superfamily enzyme YgiQ (UPF0313 family)
MNILFLADQSDLFDRLGVMYLSAGLKKDGHQTKLAYAGRLGHKGLRPLFKKFRPDIVAYSVMTGPHLKMLKVNRVLKSEHHFVAVFGGPHPTFFPEMIEEDGVDAICLGEGDAVFPEFCRRLEYDQEYWRTDSFIVKYNGNIFRNPLRARSDNLDELPFPDREIMYEADPQLLTIGNKMFLTTRGCPYTCTYCFNRKYNQLLSGKGAILRHRSPENVVREICDVRDRYPLESFWFCDDTFPLKPEGWIDKFSELYKTQVGIPFLCNFRPNVVTEEIVSKLRLAGLTTAWLGVECGNEDVAKKILHRHLSNDQIMKSAEIIKSFGIRLSTLNICGLPVPNMYEVDLQTLDINIKIRPTYAQAAILYPYPGTWIEKYAREHGYLKEDALVLESCQRSSVLTFSSKKERRRVENLQKLFAFIVWWPFLRKFCDFLCSLPLTKFYHLIYLLCYGYSFKKRMWPIAFRLNSIWNYFMLFRRMFQRS